MAKKTLKRKPVNKVAHAHAAVTHKPFKSPFVESPYYAYMAVGYPNDPSKGIEAHIQMPVKGASILTPVYKKVDYSKIKNRDQIIDTAIDQVLGAENEIGKQKQLETLLRMTNYMENKYGASDAAWNNKKTNYGFVELDKVAIDDLFTPKGDKGNFTKGQKNNFEYLKNFGLPTNQKDLEKLLLDNDPLANMAVSRLVYSSDPNPLPEADNQREVFDYWLNKYNRRGALKHQTEEDLFKIFQDGYKKYNDPGYKPNVYIDSEGHAIIDDNMGQWAHPGEVTRIASNDITMQGVPYPVLGVGADGEQRMMYPNEEHVFNQGPVTEYPMMQAKDGGWLHKYQEAGTVSTDDEKYAKFVQTLPDNLRNNDDRYYNLRGYWESLGKPEAFDYSQPKEEDGYYHAFSRNPNTGEILKKPGHPTFKYALEEDAKEGYKAYISPDGTVYTFGKDDVVPEGFKPYNANNFHHIKDNLFNRAFRDRRLMKQEILDENPALQNVMSIDNMNINYARGSQRRLLEKLHHNPEYFDKDTNQNGVLDNQNDTDEGYPYSGDISTEEGIVKNPNPGEFTTLINKKGLSRNQIKEIAANDFISHSLHYLPKYQEYSEKLNNILLNKYSPEMIQGNGGVDAYMRSLFTNDPEYAPYKEEMNFIDPSFLNEIRSYVKGTSQYKRGGVTWLNEYANGGPISFKDKKALKEQILNKYQAGGVFLPGINPLLPTVSMTPKQLKNTAELAIDAASFVPPLAMPAYIAGLPFAAYDTYNDVVTNKPWYKTAADAAGLIPGIKYIKRFPASGLKKAATVLKDLKVVNNGVNLFNTANDAVNAYNDSSLPPGTMLPQVTISPKKQNGGWLNKYSTGGEVFSTGGEKHKVYKKESPTGNGKGVKGHIMVTHPTKDKGKWDTIDLTEIAGAKTVAEGVASTKKWHKENPEYKSKRKLKTRK